MPRLASLVLIALCCGCPGGSSAPPPDAAPAKRAVQPLTEEGRARLEALGTSVATALTTSDLAAAAKPWDLDGLWDRVVEGLTISAQVNRDAKQGYVSSLHSSGGFPVRELVGATVDFRAVREDPDQGALLLLRALLPDQSLVYVECLVDDGNAAEPRLIDVYSYANGEFLSRTARRLVAPSLAEASRTPLARLVGGTSDAGKTLETLNRVIAQLQGGDLDGAWKTLEALPAAERQTKSVLLLRLRVAVARYEPLTEPPAHEEEYRQVLSEIKRVLSTDPRAQLVLLDHYLLEQDWAGFHQSLETLGQAVGEDAYLDYLHALGYSRAGEHERALEAAFAALAAEPLEAIRLGILDLYVNAEEYELAASYLEQLEDDYGYTFDFSGLPGMQPFLESEPGRAWLTRERRE